MPRPSTVTAEIEFVAGVWTDVSADVDWSIGWSFQVGRTSPQGVPQTSTLSLTLINSKGKYTAGVQVLSDGTAAPFWPNVVPRKRLRVSVNGTVRWLGYIKGWYPQMVNGVLGKTVVQAADRMDALGRVTMLSTVQSAVTALPLSYYWPLTDGSGATTAAELRGKTAMTLLQPGIAGTLGTTTFGASGVDGNGTGLQVTSSSVSKTSGLTVGAVGNGTLFSGDFTIALWMNPDALPAWVSSLNAANFFEMFDSSGNADESDMIPGFLTVAPGVTVSFTPDGAWHLFVYQFQASGSTATVYFDNVQISTGASGLFGNNVAQINLGGDVNGGSYTGRFAHLAVFSRQLTSGERTGLYNAGRGWTGETVNARIARFLGYAGLTGGDYTLDTSTVTLGSYDQAGKDVVTGAQDATTSEGGGAVFYVLAGTTTFKNRSARKPVAPALTLDAVRDLDRNVWQPSADDSTQLNQIAVTRNTAAGAQSTQTIDKSSAGPVLNTTLITYTSTDLDALNNAQDILAQNLTPGFRLPQVSVDLVTAENNLYTAAFTVGIGSRLRVASIPAGQAPATQLDCIVEGWREEYSKANGVESYRMTFDTSPADSPARMVWDDTTYGRWQASGLFLRDAITNAGTTLVVTNARTNLCSNGSFETNTTGWAAGGSVPPTLTQSAVRSVVGTKSMLVTWGTAGTIPQAGTTFTAVAGTVYTVSAWVYVPTGSPNVTLEITNGGGLSGTNSPTKDAWVQVSQTFTATASASTAVQIWPNTAPTAGQQVWVDAVMFEASSSVNSPYVDTTSGDSTLPMFTTNAGAYPMKIAIGAEHLQLNSAPGTSTAPQTFTGVTRAVDGTTAAAQAGVSTVNLWPSSAWTL